MDSVKAKRLLELRSRYFSPWRIKWATVPLLIASLDVVNVIQRLPMAGRLYGIETTLMALHAISGIVAFGAIITRRQWAFFTACAWLFFGTVRLLGVGHLQ